jgi:hypothetical protein
MGWGRARSMGAVTTARRYPTDPPRDPAHPWAPTPFGRLARTHALSVTGDAMFTTAMAGLVFFSVTRLDQARWQVAFALLFTVVPFSVAAPFIGPLIDRARGGRKWMIVGLCGLRGVLCLLLAGYRDNQYLLYPLFTAVLVFAQGHILARAALVPATVRSDVELVRANAKLSAISGGAAVVGGGFSLAVMWISGRLGTDAGPSVSLALAALVFVAAAYQAVQLPAVRIAPAPEGASETAELHGPGITAAATAVSAIRVVVGFTTFLLAVHFKDLESVDAWDSRVGLVACVVMAQAGFLLGSAVAGRVRRFMGEEQIIVAALGVLAVVGVLTSVMGELAGAVLLAFTVALASNSAKQAFDAVVQRDAPDANRGRAFARFETRFQLWWVVGALVPVALAVPPALGAALVGVLSAGAAVWFVVARGRLRAHAARRPSPLDGEPELVEPRPVSRAFLRRRGADAADDPGGDPAPAATRDRVPGTAATDPTVEVPASGSRPRRATPPAPSAEAPVDSRDPTAVLPAAVVDAASWLAEDDAAGYIEPLIAEGPWRGSYRDSGTADVTARFPVTGPGTPDRPSPPVPVRDGPAARPPGDPAWWQPPPAPPAPPARPAPSAAAPVSPGPPIDRPAGGAPADDDDAMAPPSEAAWFHAAAARGEDPPGDPDDEHDSGDAWRRP